MVSLIFFEQKRHDGAIRTGIERNGNTALLGLFIEGPEDQEDDPLGGALEWYVEMRCEGDRLPTEPEVARAWFVKHAAIFRPHLLQIAETVEIGWDDPYPITWKHFDGMESDVAVEFVCSAIRRTSNQTVSQVIQTFARNFEGKLARLQPLETALM